MKKTIKQVGLLIGTALILSGCLKNPEFRPAPDFAFKTGGNYISSNTLLYAGEQVIVGMKATWNGTDPIKSMMIYCNGALKEAFNLKADYEQGFELDTLTLTKSRDTREEWIFQIIDSQGVSSYIGFVLTLNTEAGGIDEFSVSLGMQDNTVDPPYCSVQRGRTYSNFQVENAGIQSAIDFMGAFENTNQVQLVSPDAENLPNPYPSDLSDWPVKNSTKFNLTTLRPLQFQLLNLDHLIINSISNNPTDQKSKVQNLKVDDIYAFKLNNGKYGLVWIRSVTTGSIGKVVIEVKVQQNAR
jgi:hypothetical protein